MADMLSPKEAAAILGRTVETLYEWRRKKIGPPFYKPIDAIYYKRSELEDWLKASRIDHSAA